MKKISVFFILFFNPLFCQYIQIDDDYPVQELVEKVLINTPCASVSNITVKGASFYNEEQSYGYFFKGNSNFPFQDGIILATGRAKSAPGPNLSPPPTSEGNSSWKGDSDLEQALQIANSHNATIIEFDFTPIANKLSFDYIFASEQYLRDQDSGSCAYTDGFAFLLKEKNSSEPYKNLAVLPGTSIPVRSNTVVGDGGRCTAVNQQYFGYYNYNNSAVSYNGQTSVLTAQANVTPGVVYHIKLVIADQGNPLYDSAIFLKGGSFRAETDLGEDRLLENGNPLCGQETVTLNAYQPGASSFQWFKNGVPITGETESTFTITPQSGSGTYSVEVILSGSSCISSGEIRIEYSPFPQVNNTSLKKCDYDNDGKVFFNLNNAKSAIISNPEEFNFLFYNKNPETDPSASLIANPSNYQNSVNSETVFVKIINEHNCHAIAEILLETGSSSISETVSLSSCDTKGDGTASFNVEQDFLNVKFFFSLSELELGENPIPSTFISGNTTIYGVFYDSSLCGKVLQVHVTVLPYAGKDVEEKISVCPGSISPDTPLTLTAIPGYSSYMWNTGETTDFLVVSKAGTYSVKIFSNEGCSFTQTFIITHSTVPKITQIIADGSTLTAVTDIEGNFEFSLDGIHWQNSPFFTQLSSGTYTIQVRTSDSQCLGESGQAVIFFIPNFFSPNGDGINDTWNISGFDIYPEARIKIFNRYGKLLFDQKPDGKLFQWNGKINGSILSQGTYWYIIKLNNQQILTGWFLVKNYNQL
ncbi:MAG: T9SS type B sorting domain-containing protein [Flavobacteriaceae bacterium]|jgi:gliding motility-associated-like protein|nr:T9SS type B sorting domain-containing protein [Flavobacteriaceae bacterium]